MIKAIKGTIFILISVCAFGQPNYLAIDENSKSVPDTLKTCPSIARYLTDGLSTDLEKARALYIWITHNITYDLDQINSAQSYHSSQELIEEVLKKRTGVCQDYAELFLAMSKSVGLESYLISGYTRQTNDKISDLGHAWNGVKLGSNYYLIDATWAAGYVLNDKYIHEFADTHFLIPPKDFIKTHIPFDPIWQFMDNPINNYDFKAQDFSKLDKKGMFMFRDSIRVYKNLDQLAKLETSNRRIAGSGITNKLVQKQLNKNRRQIDYIQYNLAVEKLNTGVSNFNLYIAHKNNRFRNPKLEDSYVKELIDYAIEEVYSAEKMLEGLFPGDKELNEFVVDTRNQLAGLITNLERERDFVNRYLKRWKPLRGFMFLTFANQR